MKSYIRVTTYVREDSKGNLHIDENAMRKEFNKRLEALTFEDTTPSQKARFLNGR